MRFAVHGHMAWTLLNIVYLAITKRHNRPFTSPGPLACLLATSSRHIAKLFIQTDWKTNDDIRFASAEGQATDFRSWAKGTDGNFEGNGWIPQGLFNQKYD